MTACAVCANAPPGLELVAATSVEDEDDIKSVTARCPAGKNLLGTGGEVTGGGRTWWRSTTCVPTQR